MLNIVIGVDHNELVAYHVLCHSLLCRATKPISITPLYLPSLQQNGTYWRDRDPRQSTDFTFSRFLTPWLHPSNGPCIFMDCDMLCLADIHSVLEDCNQLVDVSVVKHDYEPIPDPKFLGRVQTSYPCKNWSSFMVFNPHRMAVRNLTPTFVNTATAMHLHQFKWATSVGSLPLEWNYLVGEDEPCLVPPKIVHFTRGGPWFPEFSQCEYADLWWAEWENATAAGKVG